MRWICTATMTWIAMSAIAMAEAPITARNIRAGTIVAADDVAATDVTSPEAIALIGRQARITIYAGRPMRESDFGTPYVIARNQLVTLVFRRAALSIEAEGRALGQGGVGDTLRVLNIASRTTVTGAIQPDGTVSVLPFP